VCMAYRVRDARATYHFWVDDVLIDQFGTTLGPHGLALYMALARRSKQGKSYPSIRRLTQDTGMSESTVRRAMSRLVTLGLIAITPRTDVHGDPTSNLYTLLDLSHLSPRGPVSQTPPPVSQTPPPVSQTPGEVSHRQGGGVPQTPKGVPLEGVPEERSSNSRTSTHGNAERDKSKAKPLATDDWLYGLLQEYAEDFDVQALNDDKWWTNLANSFAHFNKEWVELAFAALVAFHEEDRTRIPQTPALWKRRMTRHLNMYYDQHVRRTSYAKR
jgi:Helix-turn-helix domain